jgi:hypothetical protein
MTCERAASSAPLADRAGHFVHGGEDPAVSRVLVVDRQSKSRVPLRGVRPRNTLVGVR